MREVFESGDDSIFTARGVWTISDEWRRYNISPIIRLLSNWLFYYIKLLPPSHSLSPLTRWKYKLNAHGIRYVILRHAFNLYSGELASLFQWQNDRLGSRPGLFLEIWNLGGDIDKFIRGVNMRKAQIYTKQY